MMSFLGIDYRFSLPVWAGLLGMGLCMVGLALLPPALPPGPRMALMEGFASMCHQIPARSPHLSGVPLAVCDRCLGIYGGVVLGVLALPACWAWRRRLSRHALLLLVGTSGIVGLDWVGPVLGVWANLPTTRFITGSGFGIALGVLAGWGVLRAESADDGRECT